MSEPLHIVRVLNVLDTREWVEDGDRLRAVPGSGVRRRCARCSREHEVHAEVLLSDGRTVIVGTGCMSKGTMGLEGRIAAGLDRLGKTIARLRCELALEEERRQRWDQLHDRWEELVRDVPALLVRERHFDDGRTIQTLRCGSSEVWLLPGQAPRDRAEQAVHVWKLDQWIELRSNAGFPRVRPEPEPLRARLEVAAQRDKHDVTAPMVAEARRHLLL